MLKAVDITKKYMGAPGENTVLEHLNFSAQAGEMCIITGKSGCGKSTFLNVLSCLDSFDEGEIIVNGKKVSCMNSRQICSMRRNETAFIFQGYNLISSMTALENVELGLKYQKKPKSVRRKAALEALHQVGLSHRLDYLPHQLSGGQQQRVAIARALVLKPKILFCDEPTGNLDKNSAKAVLENIIQLKNMGTLVIMITHDESLLPLADKRFVLRDKQIFRV